MTTPRDATISGIRTTTLRGPLVMPIANVIHLSFPEMLEATRLAGFGGLTLRAYDVEVLLAKGHSFADIRAMAADTGVELVRLDPLSAWTAMGSADDTNSDTSPADFFQLCEQLGCSYVSLNATFAAGQVPLERVVEDFASTCDLAANFGVTCDLENLPMWGVPTLNHALDVVRQADRPNGGLVFDILHFIRGGSDLKDLEAVPGDRIHTVQLNDGPLHLPADVSLFENCFDRLWPGEGEFPITEVLRVLEKIDGLAHVNAEVFSPQNKHLNASEIAAKASGSLRDALARAEIHI